MRSVRDFKDNIGKIAGKNLLENLDDVLQLGTNYRILTGIVKETISNPYEYLNRAFVLNGKTYNDVTFKDVLSGRVTELSDGVRVNTPIKNHEYIDNMPMNSIFVQIVDNSRTKTRESLIACYPFFPPHMSLPLKAGEYVWLIQEDIKGVDYYYWMCRKVGIMQVDDINHTNMERTRVIAEMYDSYENSSKTFKPSAETLEKMTSLGKSITSNLNEEAYSDILKSSYGFVNEFIGEPVPRMAKNCGDLLLQGSNNAGIHLTTEKFNKDVSGNVTPSTVSQDLDQNQINVEKVGQPAIDIFVGRKINTDKATQTLRSTRNNLSISSSLEKIHVEKNVSDADSRIQFEEINKIRDIYDGSDPNEAYREELYDESNSGLNASARLYMSGEADPDEAFETSISDVDGGTTSTGECIVTYAAKNRVVGSDVRIYASGPAYADFNENILIKTEASSANIKIQTVADSTNTFADLTKDMDLSTNGLTRINSAEKLLLTDNVNKNPVKGIGFDRGVGGEPYVLVSELEKVLITITQVLTVHAAAITGLAPLRFPPFIPAAAQVVQQTLMNPQTMTNPNKIEEAQTALTAGAAIAAFLAGGSLRSSKIIASPE